MFNEQQKKKLSEHQAYGTDVYVSNFEGMELTDYIKVASVVCAESINRLDHCVPVKG